MLLHVFLDVSLGEFNYNDHHVKMENVKLCNQLLVSVLCKLQLLSVKEVIQSKPYKDYGFCQLGHRYKLSRKYYSD